MLKKSIFGKITEKRVTVKDGIDRNHLFTNRNQYRWCYSKKQYWLVYLRWYRTKVVDGHCWSVKCLWRWRAKGWYCLWDRINCTTEIANLTGFGRLVSAKSIKKWKSTKEAKGTEWRRRNKLTVLMRWLIGDSTITIWKEIIVQNQWKNTKQQVDTCKWSKSFCKIYLNSLTW